MPSLLYVNALPVFPWDCIGIGVILANNIATPLCSNAVRRQHSTA